MSEVTVLISKGKAAVEGYLGDIEKAESEAKAAFTAKRAELAAALNAYKQTHATEVALAETLAQRAAGVVVSGAESIVPAATLAAASSGSLTEKIKTFFTSIGWKGVVVVILGVMFIRFLHTHGVI